MQDENNRVSGEIHITQSLVLRKKCRISERNAWLQEKVENVGQNSLKQDQQYFPSSTRHCNPIQYNGLRRHYNVPDKNIDS
jgi:hypothetical protein